ncbi:MAG: TonB-dependent receptor, partial [Deltaproteobacteria bacterium]|nr:TonB-dependent receptor [Deltaproteobacteria bacterium]
AGKGEVIEIRGRAPIIDQGSTKTGVTLNQDYTNNVPTGRTFGAVLGAVAGSGGDLYGTSFSGSSSIENIYIVEGINTTDPAYGLLSSNLPNEFVSETEIITGGYNAEYGRSTGGVVSVVTKAGSNEFHGSVFSYFTPGALVAEEQATPRAGSSIDRNDELTYRMDFGAEVGGPIIKDKLWFHAGINPSIWGYDVHRIIKTQVDRDDDGIPDEDANGFTILEELDRTTYSRGGQTYYFSTKLTGAVSPEHQGNLSIWGNPEKRTSWRTVTGVRDAGGLDIQDGALDAAAKWTSKFMDNKTQVDAVVGFHRNRFRELPNQPLGHRPQIRLEAEQPITNFADYEADIGGIPGGCDDSDPSDPYPNITNCPVTFYNVNGVGFREKQVTDRISGMLSVTQRVKAVGHHEIKAGLDVEQQIYTHTSDFTGGVRYRHLPSGLWRNDRWFTVTDTGDTPCGVDMDEDGVGDAMCEYREHGLDSETKTRNLAAYFRDSWSVLPNLTLNAGVRWEQQTLFIADHIVGEVSPTTGVPIPSEAFKISDMFAPRLGAIYDWTKEGRSRVFAHWGRFYESVPMDINARAYGGEVYQINYMLDADLHGGTCQEADPIGTCDLDNAWYPLYSGGGETLVTPGLGGQYLDEIVLGTEYEVLEDLKVGIQFSRRSLGRVIEDVSTDDATTYVVANPGEIDQGAIDDVWADADAARANGEDGRADFLEYMARQYEGVALFDKANRT